MRSKLRVLSRLCCERTRSFAASVLAATLREQSFTVSEATMREQSFTASVLEHIRTFKCAYTEVSNVLAHARSETSYTLAPKLMVYIEL